MKRGLGYVPDTPDARDLMLGATISTTVPLPDAVSLREYEHAILDQGPSQACIGFSLAQAIATRWNLLGGAPYMPSATFLWWCARKAQGTNLQDAPTSIREALKAARSLGIAGHTSWPNTAPHEVAARQPSFAAFGDAYDARFPLAYYRIATTTPVARVFELKLALSRGFPVEIGTLVDDAFCAARAHKPMLPFDPTRAVGGHAMVVTGYDERGIMGPNSWSEDWGNEGHFFLDWSWFTSPLVVDAWAIDCLLP